MAQPGFSFLVCADSALLREELERQASAWPGASRVVFWGDEEPGDAFWGSLQQAGLFAKRRIIIVRQGELWSAAIWKSISQALGRPQDGIWPFFCLEVGFEKGKHKIPAHIQKCAAFAFAEKKKWIWRHQGLARDKQAYARKLAQEYGLNFNQEDLAAFCAALPPDASAIGNEMAKLSLLAKDGKPTRDLLPPTSESLESDAFGLIRRLATNDIAGAWQELERDGDGSLLFFVIALLAREFRNLWQLAAGESPPMHPAEATRMRSLAKKMGFPGIASGFSAVVDAEWNVKSGKMNPQQALEFLCVAAADIFAAKGAHPLP